MIFSRDKQPTKPGLYWARCYMGHGFQHMGTPKIVRVFDRLGILWVCNNPQMKATHLTMQYAERTFWEWGDQIEVPSVGAPPSGEKEGER